MPNKQLPTNMESVVHVKSSHQERILADMHGAGINGYTIRNNGVSFSCNIRELQLQDFQWRGASHLNKYNTIY